MIEPVSTSIASAAKEVAAQLGKKMVKETANQSIKEIAKYKAKELAVKVASEAGREAIRCVGDIAEQCLRDENGEPTPAGKLISSTTRSLAAKVPLEKGVKKLLAGSSFKTAAVKEQLADKGIESTVFTGDKSLRKAFGEPELPTTRTFIVKGAEKLSGFTESLARYTEEMKLSAVPGRTFGILGARSLSVMPAERPIISELDILPDAIDIRGTPLRLEDLARAGMPIDYAIEVGVKPTAIDLNEGIEAGRRVVERIDPDKLRRVSEGLGCEKVAEARAWINGDAVDLSSMNEVTPGTIKERMDKIRQIGIDNYLVAKGETPNRLNRQGLLSVSKLIDARDLGSGSIDTMAVRIRKGPAGELGRQLVADAFKPFFEKCVFETAHEIGDRKTFADIRLIGAKLPFRSHDFFTPKGGTLSIEVKTRMAASLRSAKSEMLFQAGSRAYSDAAISVVCKDILDLPVATQRALRGDLKGSAPIYKFLPKKETLDKSLLSYIEQLSKA